MLELIVLGQIPGTNFQITFDWSIFMAGLFLLAVEVYFLRRHYPATQTNTLALELERQVQFIFKERSKPYVIYGARVPQKKIVHDAKKLAKFWALPKSSSTGSSARHDTLPVQLHLFE